ncbi:MAG: hypothetical protein AAGF44_04660, partial [Pseudomonadota bacterium]
MTKMDELSRLKAAFKAAPTAAPDSQAMARALAAAKAEFASPGQGSEAVARPRGSRAAQMRERLVNLIGSAKMLH